MEKIIFFALVIPIIGFVLYLGATAIMKGFNAKEANRSEKDETTLQDDFCLLYTSPSPRDRTRSRMPSSA